MILFSIILFIYFLFLGYILKNIYIGNLNYLIYYLLLFLPFYTFFQLISLKLTGHVFSVHIIKYSKDFVIFSSLCVYILGYKNEWIKFSFKFSFLDKLIILFTLITLIFTVIPIGQADFISRILYSKNIFIISIVYFFGRLSIVSSEQWKFVKIILIFLVVFGFSVSGIEYFSNHHLHSILNYSEYLINIYDRMPVGNFGLSWTFERNPFQGRFAAFFSDPLEFSASLILFLSFFLFELYQSKLKSHKFINILFLVMIFCSFLFAYSRASIVSAFFILIVSLILIKKYNLLYRVFFFFIIISLLVFFNASNDFIYFLEDTLSFRELSSLGHLFEWIEGVLTIVENPFGIGLAMSGNASSVDQSIKIGGENQFLIYGIQMGIISLIIYLLMISISIYHSFKVFLLSKTNHVKSIAFVSGLTKLGLLIPLFTANAELYLFVSLFSWFLVGVTETNFLKSSQSIDNGFM